MTRTARLTTKKWKMMPHSLLACVDLETAISKGLDIVLMCSELRPEQCHRSKLIGRVLMDRGFMTSHIDADGKLVGQDNIVKRITGGQEDFFGASPDVVRSRGAYKAP